MPTLEIKIKETVTVFDLADFNQGAFYGWELVHKTYWDFMRSEEANLTLVFEKKDNKSPPTLGISVGEDVGTKEVLGG